jgi:hypothetical protein
MNVVEVEVVLTRFKQKAHDFLNAVIFEETIAKHLHAFNSKEII